jgi:hypothetical protein
MEHAHGEYCDMILTSVILTVALVLLHENSHYVCRNHPGANMFRRLEHSLCKTGSVTYTAHVNAGSTRTAATGGTIVAAVER